jgi:hypothetical protein
MLSAFNKIVKWVGHIPKDIADITSDVCSGNDTKVNTLYVVLLLALNVLIGLLLVDTFTQYKVNGELYQIMSIGIIAPSLTIMMEKFKNRT